MQVLCAISTANCLPAALGYRVPSTDAPLGALVMGSIVSYCVCCVAVAYPKVYTALFPTCMLFASTSYIGTFKCTTRPRSYRSRLSIPCSPAVRVHHVPSQLSKGPATLSSRCFFTPETFLTLNPPLCTGETEL